MRVKTWAIGGLAAAMFAGSPGARAQTDGSRHTRLAWLTAIETHEAGQLDAAATQVASWTRTDLENVLGDLKRSPPAPDDLDRVLKRAALLHADIAMLKRLPAGYDLPPDDHAVVMIRDGKQVGARTGTSHWMFARALLDTLRTPSKDEYVRLWYQATGAFLQEWNEFPELELHLARGRLLFPDDPVLLVYAGAIHENFAEPGIQNAFNQLITLTRGARLVKPPVELPSAERRAAASLFLRALAVDPTLSEARIRLGYVYGRLQQHREAIDQFELALKQRLPPTWQYFACLLLGREQQALGDLGSAQASFERAAELAPTAQAPRLGLSQLARDREDLPGALSPLKLFAVPSNTWPRDEPLWEFHKIHLPEAADLIAALRAQSSARPGSKGSIRSSRGPLSSHTAN